MNVINSRAACATPLKSGISPQAFQQISRNARGITTSSQHQSQAATTSSSSSPGQNHRRKSLSPPQKRFLDSALRVNQAGELAATLIYTHQTPPINNAHPHLRPLMKHMYDQEAGHFKYFNTALARHRIRPTAMYPVWYAAASVLGWGTGVLGREVAMACTEAVETEIGEHYNSQVKELLGWFEEMEAKGEEPGEELRILVENVRRIRDEELEHLDHAVQNDAKAANPYELLTGIIRAGCRGAIWVSEKV
ncbi:COQ7-domain-containing protein [Polychaeton citri CBS 116435]|uniref:5-demethoxyubiquinone hydroxylase, mitochondrial n=1 Tax=Polychaeton citri CBS 116435 TaxID=1314669 RepID=A0A9P4Q5R6_9PEZI|nr:COQ7-domain-containing protein [Polychaeton citri CBS 116435]